MIKIVLDTNVFISGIFWSGPPAKILSAWEQGMIKVVYSRDVLDEYIRVANILNKKYPEVDIAPFINLVTIYGQLIKAVELKEQVSCDPDDDKFVAAALTANCPIISGDSDLLDIDGYAGISVMKPSLFVKHHLVSP